MQGKAIARNVVAAHALLKNPDLAEKVFRAELEKRPRSARSLFGLRESLKAQKKDYAARQIDQQFQAAWKNAEVKALRLEDYY